MLTLTFRNAACKGYSFPVTGIRLTGKDHKAQTQESFTVSLFAACGGKNCPPKSYRDVNPNAWYHSAEAFEYGLLVAATRSGKEISDYNLLDVEEIASVLPKLNAAKRLPGLTAKELYVDSKIPFGFNYVDSTLDITHDKDQQGDHGTHVSGIATANRYVVRTDGTYGYADSGVVGFTTAGVAYIDGVMASLTKTDTVVCMSAGNSGNWATNTVNGMLYPEDANTGRVGSPGAYANSLAVASANNTGSTGSYFSMGSDRYGYADGAGKSFSSGATCKSLAFTTLDKSADKSGTAYPYVFLGDPTDPEDTVKYGGGKADFTDLTGKIVFVFRGNGVAFTDKQINADAAKAAAIVVYNNEAGYDAIYVACTKALPFVTIRQDQMERILAASTKGEDGRWGGTLTVYGSGVYTDTEATGGEITMSYFSAWGAPGDLTLKPEITAPGGNIKRQVRCVLAYSG